ncbi:hypothetical protein Tco_0526392 [Tanacetum coccineum]
MAPMALSDSEVTNDKSCSKACLKNYEALKKQYDDLLVKLDDTGFKAATYKRGLSILEGQILKYKEHEVLFSEEIALLKRSVGHKEYQMGLLRTELEKVKEEKEGFEFKIAKFEKSAKDLDQLLANQITDKSKKGFGYNVVPSPHPLILNRPTPLDLSYSGLEEFKQPEVNEYGPRDSSLKPTTGCDKESDNSKENTDDSLKQQQKTDSKTSSVKSPLKVDKDWKEKFFCPANHVREEEPKKARENNDAPIIEDWVSDDEDEVEPIPKVEKKTVIPTATKKEFVKPEKPVRRSVRMTHSNPRRNMIPQAVLMRSGIKAVNTAKPKDAHNVVKRNWFHDVKASACWVWRPKQKEILDNVSKHNSASMILKRLDYIDVQGRFKWMHRLRGGKSAAKKKKNPEKSATIEELTTAGYRVTTAGSRLLLLVRKLMLLKVFLLFQLKGGAEEEQLGFILSCMDGLILTNIPDRWVWSLEATVRLDKLPTRLNLSLKGHHLWRKFMRWWELEVIDLASYDDWMLWLNSSWLFKRLKEILEGVCYVKWWLIWRFKNQLLFGATNPHRKLLFDDLV